jgi:PAS domain S-box-containing protein
MDTLISIKSCFEEEFKSEHPFCTLLMEMPIIVCELARDGTTIFVNNAIHDATGYKPDELIGRNWWDILYPGGSYAQVEKHLKEIEKQDVFNFEMSLTDKNGEQIPILWSSANTYNEKGELEKILSFGTNIKKLKNIQESLAESKERLRVFSDATSEGIIIHDHGKILDANRQLLEITGYTMGELDKVNCIDQLVIPSDREKVWKIVESGSENYYEIQGIKKDGSPIPVGIKGRNIQYMGKPTRVAFIRDLTEQKQAEEKLRQEKVLLEKFLETTPVGTVVLKPDGSIIYSNTQAEVILDIPKIKLTEMNYFNPLFQIVDLEGNPLPEEQLTIHKVLKTRKPVLNVQRGLKFDDRLIYISINAAPICDEKGEVEKIIYTFDDVTESLLAERQLQESEERYQKLADATSEAIVVNEDGKIIDINKRFEEMFGYTLDEISEIGDFARLAESESVEGLCRQAQTGSDEPFEIKAIKKDGTVFPALTRGKMLKYKGHYARIITIQDLTEIKQAETELKSERDLFNNIAETSPTGIIVFDRMGKTVFVNKMIRKLMNLKDTDKPDYFFNDPRWDIRGIDGEMIPEKDLPFLKVINTGQTVQNFPMLVSVAHGRNIFVSINNSPMFDEKNEIVGVIATVEDITHRIKAERKLRELNNQLEERANLLTRSNEELEHFAFVASHDLKEPLNIIMGFAKLLNKQYKDKLDPKATEFLSFIVDETGRMQNLIKGLLELSRVSTRGKPFKKVDVNKVLDKALAGLQIMITENEAEIISEELPVIKGDEVQIGQVFQNLISNAVTFRSASSPVIHIAARKEKNTYLFSVSDNGIGIKPEDHDKVFEVFQTGKIGAGKGGTGIGLAICKKIIERHGGDIWVESEPEKGSTFYFTIPIHDN